VSASDGDIVEETHCPVARSVDLMGDRWSILIIRELLLGVTRFQDLQAQTGASGQMLTSRLKRLMADGLVERQAYSERPPRHAYRLTPKGVHLMPVILALRAWGERWCKPEGAQPAVRMFHGACGTELDLDGNCPACGRLVAWMDMRGQPGEAWTEERRHLITKFAAQRRASPVPQAESEP
jgi:DNA-binding HxlR family transcriptional regulator